MTHHRIFFTIWAFLFLIVLVPSIGFSQVRERERAPAQTTGTFKDKIWYGGSLGLGLGSGGGFTNFNFGLFPMAGYKIVPWFSVGPRLGIDYNYYKAPASTSNNFVSTNVLNFYGGIFARAKVYKWIFMQGEYGVDSGSYPLFSNGRLLVDNDNKVIKQTVIREQGLIGVGYNSGGVFASEILVLYDLLVAQNSLFSPWNYRFGFTYKF